MFHDVYGRFLNVSLVLAIHGFCFCLSANAQLTVLSSGNVAEQWKATQVEAIQRQLRESQGSEELLDELNSQKDWLRAWAPGSMAETSVFEQSEFIDAVAEPIIDPDGLATEYRDRLLGKNAKPTIEDTQALRDALLAHPDDLGIRQLHLHWLDQIQYRKTYARQIIESARRVLNLLEQQPDSDEVRLARGYCYFREARALAYCELPEVLARQAIDNPELHEQELIGAYTQAVDLLGRNHPEMILLEVRMLRRDGWLGRALLLLEKSASVVEPQWYLKKRRDLLEELSWSYPAKEAAAIYAKTFPEAVAAEQKEAESDE